MGKVKYKKPSDNFIKNSSKNESSNIRASIGMDQAVKEYYYIDVDNLTPYEKQARRAFDDGEINQLADTIKEHGVTSPLMVIASQKELGKFEVISGERRLRAAKSIGLEKVPCIIIKDGERAEEIALIENIQRMDLHPIELAQALSSLLSKKEWGDVSKLSQKIGKKQSTVSEHLSYASLPGMIKKYLIEKNIRSRDVLRKLVNSKSVEEMEIVLGIKQQAKSVKSQSILRISWGENGIHVQAGQLLNLEQDQKEKIKEMLIDIIKKLEAL